MATIILWRKVGNNDVLTSGVQDDIYGQNYMNYESV
jgi:hypothetical protein